MWSARPFKGGEQQMVRSRRRVLLVVLVMSLSINLASVFGQESAAKPQPKVIRVEAQGKEYIQLLGGPPESVVMRSGAVTLQPGKTVGKHNTEAYEELVIVQEGEGAMILADGKQLEMKVGNVLYCPPSTEHDVKNTGSTVLRYIYVVAKTR
jgi:mannose-6-phosphate isomerase-like protein (cupin superfamily)